MTDPRNALDVPAVMERFSVAAQLLDDAAARVRTLGVAAESATDNASTLGEAAQSLTSAAGMMGEVVAGMKAAHDALDETMMLAREFLKSTDVSAVRETLRQVEERVSGLEQASTDVTEKVSQMPPTKNAGSGRSRRPSTVPPRWSANWTPLNSNWRV